jgi:hypothetical protein
MTEPAEAAEHVGGGTSGSAMSNGDIRLPIKTKTAPEGAVLQN